MTIAHDLLETAIASCEFLTSNGDLCIAQHKDAKMYEQN